MAIVQVSDRSVAYEVTGKGPKLFLLHGWANTWEAWLPVIPYLSDAFTVIAIDLPGFGKSESPATGWSTSDYSIWFEQFLSIVGITPTAKPFYCAGHSFGGKILVDYTAMQRQFQPAKQILIDASGIRYELSAKQKMLRTLSTVLPSKLKQAASTQVKERIYQRFGAETDYLAATPFQKATLQKILTEDLRLQLSRISIPTLLVWGRLPKFPPLWHGEEFHRLIPNSQLKVFESGHFPHHDHPQAVAEAISTFLKDSS